MPTRNHKILKRNTILNNSIESKKNKNRKISGLTCTWKTESTSTKTTLDINRLKTILYSSNQNNNLNHKKNRNNNFDNSLKTILKNNIDYSDYFKINNQKSAKNLKLKFNFDDFNKYITQTKNINSVKNYVNGHNRLNKFIEGDKIYNSRISNIGNESIKENDYLYDKKNTYNHFYKNKNYSTNDKNNSFTYNHFYRNNNNNINTYNSINSKNNSINITNINKQNDLNINNNEMIKIYNEEGNSINNDIRNNIKKIKNKEELMQLKNIFENLRLENKMIQTELNILHNQNHQLEQKQKDKNKMIYLNIKNIFSHTINDIKINNNEINLNNYYKNMIKKSSLKDKVEILRNIYLDEKLKNSLVKKTYGLLLDLKKNGNNEEEDLKNKFDMNENIKNIWKMINSLMKDTEKVKNYNNNFESNMKNKIREYEIYKIYYNKWISIFSINNREDLKNRIIDLINDQHYNDNEEFKLYSLLMNKNKY
jgi:hypothetical protein